MNHTELCLKIATPVHTCLCACHDYFHLDLQDIHSSHKLFIHPSIRILQCLSCTESQGTWSLSQRTGDTLGRVPTHHGAQSHTVTYYGHFIYANQPPTFIFGLLEETLEEIKPSTLEV